MTSAKALIAGMAFAVLLAALAPVLGSNGGAGYSETAQPALLFGASLLSLRVSLMYRAEMRILFLCLGAFLLLLGLVTVTVLVEEVADALAGNFLRALLGYQLLTYAFLIVAMLMALRITGLTRIRLRGQLSLLAVIALGIVIVSRSFSTFSDIADSSGEAAAIYLAIRILDVVVMVMVAPVLVLYAQNARTRRQESLTFSVIGASIVASLVFVYLYELVSGDSLRDIAFNDYQEGSLLDALYIFGYAALVVGIFTHWRHQEWSMAAVERVLGYRDSADPS